MLDAFLAQLPAPEDVPAVELAVEIHQPLLHPFEHAADLLQLDDEVVDLARYFVERGESSQQTQQRVAQLSKAVVSESNAALSEAWALRRLATRFAAWQEDELPSEAKQRIRDMKRDHLSRLKVHCRTLRAQLEPALIGIAGEMNAANVSPEASPQAQVLQVFKSVEQVYQLTHKLFAGTGLPSDTPEQSARQLFNALARMDGALEP